MATKIEPRFLIHASMGRAMTSEPTYSVLTVMHSAPASYILRWMCQNWPKKQTYILHCNKSKTTLFHSHCSILVILLYLLVTSYLKAFLIYLSNLGNTLKLSGKKPSLRPSWGHLETMLRLTVGIKENQYFQNILHCVALGLHNKKV